MVEQALVHGFYNEVIVLYETHSGRLRSEGAEGAYYEALMHVDAEKCVALQEEEEEEAALSKITIPAIS